MAPAHAVTYGRGNVDAVTAASSANLAAFRDARVFDAVASMPGYTDEQRSSTGE